MPIQLKLKSSPDDLDQQRKRQSMTVHYTTSFEINSFHSFVQTFLQLWVLVINQATQFTSRESDKHASMVSALWSTFDTVFHAP